MTGACIIQCAVGDEAEAEVIAEALLAGRLAACVQFMPVRSRYVWKGAAESADEVLLLIKTRADLFDAVRTAIRSLHSYETPEILATPVQAIDGEYLAWLLESTGGPT